LSTNLNNTMKLQHLFCSAIVLFTLTSCFVGPGYGRPIRPVVGPPIILPYGARPYPYGGVNYYEHRGVWYRPHPNGNGHFIVPRPF
jgi:hypothetical protein